MLLEGKGPPIMGEWKGTLGNPPSLNISQAKHVAKEAQSVASMYKGQTYWELQNVRGELLTGLLEKLEKRLTRANFSAETIAAIWKIICAEHWQE